MFCSPNGWQSHAETVGQGSGVRRSGGSQNNLQDGVVAEVRLTMVPGAGEKEGLETLERHLGKESHRQTLTRAATLTGTASDPRFSLSMATHYLSFYFSPLRFSHLKNERIEL